MGYTNYWQRFDKPLCKEFVDEVKAVFAECKEKGIVLVGDYDYNENGRPVIKHRDPIADENIVCFNGNPETGEDCESLVISNTDFEFTRQYFPWRIEQSKDGTIFEFCKTRREPYDYAVKKVLALAEKYGLVKDVSNDDD